MSTNGIKKGRPFTLVCVLAALFAVTPLVSGQVSTTQAPARTSNIQSIPNGSKLKFKGVVIGQEADTFTIRDRNRTDYHVAINDRTSIKTHGGFLRSGKRYPASELLRGLIVEVEGRGDQQGRLLAEKIRFNESDMRAAITSDTRVTPVEENQQRMAGQMDELYAVAAEARREVEVVHERVSALDDFDVSETVAVNFRVNSAVLSPEAKSQLDDFATRALSSKGFMVEVAGHTDATGSESKNFRLSRARADAVVQYLAVRHKIPLRRFVTPMGFGKTEFVAENSTAAGRAQNRRVEVKMLMNRGLTRAVPVSNKP